MRIIKILLAVIALSTGASFSYAADSCSFWNLVCQWNQLSLQGQDAPRTEKQFPATVQKTSPEVEKKALQDMLGQQHPIRDFVKNLFHKKDVTPEPYSQKTGYDPNDPFGSLAREKASQLKQQGAGQNSQPSKLPSTSQQQKSSAGWDCSGASCYRVENGKIITTPRNDTFGEPTPQQPILPTPQQTRTDQSNTGRSPSVAANRWSLADARQSMMAAAAAAPQARRVPNDWAYQQIKAIAEGRQPTRAQPLPIVSYGGVAPRYTVGGISLTKAAAERMALNFDIEGLALRDGQFVIAGSGNSTTRLDAALFLTALRAACSTRDPYFSLDPPNGAAWSEQGDRASKAVWSRVQNELNKDTGSGFEIQSFSVKQRYPSLWAELAPEFPELRSRLVFQPEWLRETRFGEILYKADVLLKELTTGVSLVKPEIPLRAKEIPGYVPAGERRTIRDFLTADGQGESQGFRGHRLWFDLMPDASANATNPQNASDLRLDKGKLPGLYPILERRGLIGGREPTPIQKAAFSADGGVIDLSQIYPKMFVRKHDHASGKDIMDVDVEYERASKDVNERTELYANAYQELRDLTDVFRAYVASVKIAKENPKVCGATNTPLTEGEKVSTPLPEFHPTEIVLTAAQYGWRDGRGRYWQLISGSTISGGISLRGKAFFATAGSGTSTSITRAIKEDLAEGIPAPTWDGKSGRRYMAFNMDLREPPRKVPITATSSAE